MRLVLTIPGEPVAKQRPRVTKFGTYTPEKTVNYETYVKYCFMTQHSLHKPILGPVRMNIVACFSIPQSASKKNKAAMGQGEIRPTKKPDIDNIVKIIADALNNLAYSDDKQIVSCTVEKYYSNISKVVVELEEV